MSLHARGLIAFTLTGKRAAVGDPLMVVATVADWHGLPTSIEASSGAPPHLGGRSRAHRAVGDRETCQARTSSSRALSGRYGAKGGCSCARAHVAGCDMPAMAGLSPASVICEIMITMVPWPHAGLLDSRRSTAKIAPSRTSSIFAARTRSWSSAWLAHRATP